LGVAPEKKQPFGTVSRKHLADLVFGKTVTVTYRKVDRYGRQIGVLHVGDIDANLAQLRAGLAWHYKHYEREQPYKDRAAYAAAEREASEHKRGLWRDRDPISPWDYRRRR
jgi:endonuclease YncB( thermonuclease family)